MVQIAWLGRVVWISGDPRGHDRGDHRVASCGGARVPCFGGDLWIFARAKRATCVHFGLWSAS